MPESFEDKMKKNDDEKRSPDESKDENNRSEIRIKGLLEKQSNLEKELEDERKARKELEFKNEFSQSLSSFPDAKDHENDVKEKVSKGYSIRAAILETLDEKGKLGSKNDSQSDHRPSPYAGMGGSADTPPPSTEKKDPKTMTQAERRAALIEAAKNGEWGIQ
ncbi:MAG: hypothetical protein KGN01_07150 [Patescibacteria group bacterium]|nr:hypothetical protein [Patescibacteria group bacterium]